MKVKVSLMILLVSFIFLVGCGNNSKTYTKEMIAEKTGWTKMSERERTEEDIVCNEYWFAGKRMTYVDALDFLLCQNASEAKKIMKNLKQYYEITEETDDYFIGYETGVTDTTVKEFVYRSGNLVVRMEVEADGHFYNGLGYPESTDKDMPQDEKTLITDIMKNW